MSFGIDARQNARPSLPDKSHSTDCKDPLFTDTNLRRYVQFLIFNEALYKNESRSLQLSVRANSSEPANLPLALDLLKKILKDGTDQNRRNCVYCKVLMATPIDLHKKNCVWRRAWQLVSEKER